MRTVWPGAEFRVELRCDEPGVVAQLDDLDQPVVGRGPTKDHARFPHRLSVGVVELETMPVELIDDRLRIRLGRQGAGLELAGKETEPHLAPLLCDVALLRQQVYHGVA